MIVEMPWLVLKFFEVVWMKEKWRVEDWGNVEV